MNTKKQTKFLLEKLLVEIDLANDGCTTEQEFCTMVMQWKDAIQRVHEGKETLPEMWKN